MSAESGNPVPRHVAVILDGNRRWARAKGLPAFMGHKAGYDNLQTIGAHAIDQGVEYFTAFVFSTENWNRSREEVEYIMNILKDGLTKDVNFFTQHDIRLHWVGSANNVSPELRDQIREVEAKTASHQRGQINVCFNYGARSDLVQAVQNVVREGLKPDDIDEATISAHLGTAGVPDPDLIIRTSGEQRLSNFLLWECAYSELYFSPKNWPEFDKLDFDAAIGEYASRSRRFGK